MIATSASDARIFRLSPTSLSAAEARIRRKSAPLYVIMVAGFFLPLFLHPENRNDLAVLFVTVTFFSLLLAFVVIRTVRKTRACVRKLWDTFELELTPTHVTRRNADTPTASIAFADVTGIVRYPGRGLLLKTSRALQTVEIPEGVHDYDQAVEYVSQHSPVPIVVSQERAWNSPTFALLVGLAGWVAFLNVHSRRPTLIMGTALVALCAWAIWAVNRSPNISRARTRSLLYGFLMVICLIRMGYAAGLLK
jgi:hypothetical protein